MARPRKNLPVNAADVIRTLARHGAGEVEIAQALGMSFKTWKRLREEDADTKAIYAEARSIEESQLVGSLFKQALGSPAEFDADGNEVRNEVKPNPSAAMFLLKTRHYYREMGPVDGADDGRVNISINLPASLDPDKYEKLIEITPQPHDQSEAA